VVRSRAVSRGLAGLDVRAAFLEHCAPSLPQVLRALGSPGSPGSPGAVSPGTVSPGTEPRAVSPGAVVVPLLLTAAYHSKTDIPAQLAAARASAAGAVGITGSGGPGGSVADVALAGTLGPDRLLLTALERRLAEADVALDDASRARTSVVLAAAGSADPAANATIARLAAGWRRDGRWRAVVPAYASGAAGPRPDEAVLALRAARDGSPGGPGGPGGPDGPGGPGPIVVATYLLAPGYFADKIRAAALAAGADAVCGALGAAPEVADVVLGRYEGSLGLGFAPSRGERFVARAQ
jgi:sirohydrochlorin ferrochelatase